MIICKYKFPKGSDMFLYEVLDKLGFKGMKYNAFFMANPYRMYELKCTEEEYLVLKLKDPNFVNISDHDYL